VDEKLKNLAEKIRQIANIPEEETFGSVMAILMIISITLTLIRVMQECNKTKLSTTSSKEDKVSLYGTELRHYSIGKGWFKKCQKNSTICTEHLCLMLYCLQEKLSRTRKYQL